MSIVFSVLKEWKKKACQEKGMPTDTCILPKMTERLSKPMAEEALRRLKTVGPINTKSAETIVREWIGGLKKNGDALTKFKTTMSRYNLFGIGSTFDKKADAAYSILFRRLIEPSASEIKKQLAEALKDLRECRAKLEASSKLSLVINKELKEELKDVDAQLKNMDGSEPGKFGRRPLTYKRYKQIRNPVWFGNLLRAVRRSNLRKKV